MISGYIFDCVDAVEPIADTLGELWGNAAIYNVIGALGGACAVSYDAGDMTADLAAGQVTHFGVQVVVPAAANGYTFVSDPTNPRWTWTAISSTGTPVLVSGSAAATPSVPELGDRVATSLNLVQAGQTISANMTYKLDKRIPAPVLDVFDGTLTLFRANRRLLAEYTAQGNTANGTVSAVGIGLRQNPSGASDVPTLLTGEAYMLFGSAASAASIGVFAGTSFDAITPARSPRFLMRVLLPAASANVTSWTAGLGGDSPAGDQAGLRIVTTGNTFFVTRQAAAETATDLGVLSRAVILGFEIESSDAGVTWVCRNEAGTILATHTTNVPTASGAEEMGIYYTYATSTIPMGIAYFRAEGTTP